MKNYIFILTILNAQEAVDGWVLNLIYNVGVAGLGFRYIALCGKRDES